ncbi:hypothetical protein HAX54_022403 [Datura stramonium]|uniref:Uncharacterized protein n=1 Tax=Datura stramonium TaxID=4076 RepID=A0ABS8RJS1_DATST|nr:hypothetical protein [Datura stramonium]
MLQRSKLSANKEGISIGSRTVKNHPKGRRAGVKGQSLVFDLIASREKSNAEIERLIGLLAKEEAKIMRRKANPTEESGLIVALRQENEELKVEVKELTRKLLHAHETFNDRIASLH